SAICTRTRSEPSRRGSLTRQRTSSPRAVNLLSSGSPMFPVAPVRSSTGREGTGGPPSVELAAPNGTRDRKTRRPMAYVIAEPCIGTKDNSCVEVCPVDCIHPTPDEPDYDSVEMLYIAPA